jgi:glucose/arabinose dehydrogenase
VNYSRHRLVVPALILAAALCACATSRTGPVPSPQSSLGANAALGLAAARHTALPTAFMSGMFIGEHGSWNRKPLVGYKVVFVPFVNGRPAGAPIDVLTGFVSSTGDVWGRPVGVALDRHGALLVADDVGNTVWRAIATP